MRDIFNVDIHAGKLGNLRRRAGHSGASNIHTMAYDIVKLEQSKGSADCVLIDAPCSGMGVFRRNPDSKWHLTEQDIVDLAAKQKGILSEYSELVRPGGRLVYATCTISWDENEEVVREFLEENTDFHIIPASEINPDLFNKFITGEGFFGAVMRKL